MNEEKSLKYLGNYIMVTRHLPEWLEKDPKAFALLRVIATRAKREKKYEIFNGESIFLEPRQAIIGRMSTSKEIGLSEAEYRTALKHLLKTSIISTIQTTSRYTIVSLCSDDLIDINVHSEQPGGSPPAYTAHATNKEERRKKLINTGIFSKPVLNEEWLKQAKLENPDIPDLEDRIHGD